MKSIHGSRLAEMLNKSFDGEVLLENASVSLRIRGVGEVEHSSRDIYAAEGKFRLAPSRDCDRNYNLSLIVNEEVVSKLSFTLAHGKNATYSRGDVSPDAIIVPVDFDDHAFLQINYFPPNRILF